MPWQFEQVAGPFAFTEGPVWDGDRVIFTDIPNSRILVSPDGNRLYVAESDYDNPEHMQLRAYPIQPDGGSGEYRVLYNFYPHRAIDGMCLDEDGNIVPTAGWDESGPGPMLYLFSPSGRVLETRPCPAPPTNCAFGGDDLSTLYVTAQDGCLYAADTDRTGYLEAPTERRFHWR